VGCFRAEENGTDEIEMVLKRILKPVDKKNLDPLNLEPYLPMKLEKNHLA